MKNQRKFFIVSLIFLCLLVSLASVSAEDLNTISDGEVSGDVDVVVTNPWDTSGELSYEIPDDVKDVDYAGLYVNVYSGKAAPTNGAESNVSMTCNGETEQIASEQLVSTEGSSDATVYTINDHTTKNYADFQMIYDITDKLQGKTGTITFNVTNSKIDGYDFDGRIKLIGLVFAYNDGDDDKVSYWVNSGQSWTKTDSKSTFDVGTIENEISKATIDNVALSSSDGRYTFNDDVLEATEHASGSYYQYNQFDVKDKVVNGTNTLIYAYNGTSAYGSFKNVLSVLTVQALPSVSADVALTGEYSAAVAYAGTENVVKVTVTNDGEKSTDYVVDFYVDGAKVSSDNLTIAKGEKAVLLVTDDTIRPVTEKTVNGAENDKVNYTVIVSEKDGAVLAEATITPSILYDGYLGKDYAYPAENITLFNTVAINGDIIIDTKDASTYLGAATTNRTDVWAIDIAADAVIVNAYVYVPYNWNKYGMPMAWNCTFNGANIVAVATYKDQSNLGTYGKHDYGLFVYDVSDLIADGDNEFVLNKEFNQTAVYPSTLVILYNFTTADTIQTVYMFNGADLLTASSYNLANRVVSSNSVLDVDDVENVYNAKLYVFAAGAQAGEGNLIVNGEEFTDVWSGTSQTTDLVEVDLTDSLAESNTVSFVATGSTILALQQFVVVEYYGTAADLQEIIDDAEPGATIDLGDRVFKDISNVNITKDVAITGGTIVGSESADPIFVIAPKSENGPSEVNITGVDFKVNNANTIVKATGENATDGTSIEVPAINIKDNTIELASDDVVAESINVLELDSERPVLSPTNDIAISGNTIAAGINPFEFEVTSVASGDDVSIVPQKIVPEKKATVIVYENMTTTALGPSDGRSGEYFYFNLTDADGNPIANTPMQIGFNGKIYDYEHNNISTDENGTAKLQINLGYKGDYTFAICFLGDDDYNASFAVAVIKVGTQQPKLNVPNKSYSASAKTKTLTATFLTDKGNPIAGKSIKFTVNGKTYSAKTNDNGVATVKVSLNKKGTYNFTVKYGGDSTYAAVTQKAKLTIK